MKRFSTAYLVLVVALVPTLIAYTRVTRNGQVQERLRFQDRSRVAMDSVQGGLADYEATVRAIAGFFEPSTPFTTNDWHQFLASIDVERRYPGIRLVGYVPLPLLKPVPGVPGATPAANPIALTGEYVKRFGATNSAQANAPSTVLLRADALQQLLQTGAPVVVSGVPVGPGPDEAAGFLTYYPVFRTGLNPQDRVLSGVVFSSFAPQRLLGSLNRSQLDSTLYVDMHVPRGSAALPVAATLAKAPAKAQLWSTHALRVFRQPVNVRIAALPSFAIRSEVQLAQLVLWGGVIFSLLLFSIAATQAAAHNASESLNQRLLASEDQLLRANGELERRIEQHKATEQLLERERDLLRTLLDHSPDRIYFKDRESRFIKCGRSVLGVLGVGEAPSAIGKTDADFFTPEHAATTRAMELQIMETGQPALDVVQKETWRDGRETWVMLSKMPLRDNQGNIIGTFGTSKDITALKNTELELQRKKDLLDLTLRSIGDGVVTTDTNGRVVLFNKVAEQLTGIKASHAVGKPLHEVFRRQTGAEPAAELDPVQQAIQSGEVVINERGSLLFSADGTERQIAESVAPIVNRDGHTIGAVLVFRDITDKLKTEAELLRASKLESIGVLAGGIAHDFNNILTVILGNISLARMLNDKMPPQLNNVLAEAEKASLRARDLTTRLLTFAKGGAPIKKTVPPGPLLRDATKAALQGSEVNYQFFIADDLWSVHADEGQLAQVFQNLVQHARNSVGDKLAIEVHASNQEIANDPLLLLKPGRYVRVSVRDHGAGLQPEQLNKIFDPYFSAKKNGHGLELATAYSIVRKHEGQIRVESVAGQGTVFHVYLPATMPETAAPAADKPKPVRPAEGTILVMDDEPSIRQLAAILLKKIGYTTALAADGNEAIEKYEAARRSGSPYAAVIMDLTIPNGMGGAEAIKQLRRLDPNVKAIVSSGYSNDPVMANFREYGFAGVVPKPYSASDLECALGDLLALEDTVALAETSDSADGAITHVA